MNLEQVRNIADLRRLAQRRLPEFVFQPMEFGSGDGSGPLDNVASFGDYRLLGRVLSDLHAVSSRVVLWDRQYQSAFGIAPMGFSDFFRRDADRHLARAAAEAKLPFVLSGGGNASLESIARDHPEHTWYQLYGTCDRRVMDDFIHRAREAGIGTLVFTVDFQAMPQNDWQMRMRLAPHAPIPSRSLAYLLWQLLTHPKWTLEFAHGGLPLLEGWRPYAPVDTGCEIQRYYRSQVPAPQSWKDLERVRGLWPGKLVIKGLMSVSDARRARSAGVDAVMVSNHGGNRLDRLMPPLLLLGELGRELGSQMPLFLDGGIRRGSDILVAYCLGASFCFVGRAALYGVAAGALAGARRSLAILRTELEQGMSMLGISSMQECQPTLVRERLRAPAPFTI